MDERVLTVSELVRDIKAAVESNFGVVVLRGEVTNLRASFSGHTYFTLKDDAAQIRCVLFKGQRMAAERTIAEDAEYLVWGRVSLYEARADLSLIVSFFMPAGEGKEALRIKALKEKLAKEGIFDDARKKPLPRFVEHIGVVTAAGGAAIRDIIRVGRDRYPRLRITLYPALVQGEKAEETIVRGVELLGSLPGIDAIIVGRGGGSKEDLMAFNGESLARAVAACPVPVVAAVGHETDRTILDLVASYSVATPSAAAELCTAEASELAREAAGIAAFLGERTGGILRDHWMRLDRALLSLPRPAEWIQRLRLRLSELAASLEKEALRLHRAADRRLAELVLRVETLSPLRPLEQGYALIRQNGVTVKRLATLDAVVPFSVRFADGETTAEVKKRGQATCAPDPNE
ncbi:MAG TPA: exodeoxyribonuclease VII large subunit [bacterium]|nr:exodeoxyribonuclease VII large subunit [bacterium]